MHVRVNTPGDDVISFADRIYGLWIILDGTFGDGQAGPIYGGSIQGNVFVRIGVVIPQFGNNGHESHIVHYGIRRRRGLRCFVGWFMDKAAY